MRYLSRLGLRLEFAACFFFAMAASRCGASSHGAVIEPSAHESLCEEPRAAIFGVYPLGNKTSQPIQTEGSEDLLISAMTNSGCFTLIERDKLKVLIDEMKLCADTNADKDMFDCKSFAKAGHLLGVQYYLVGNIVLFEENVEGAVLSAKVGGLLGLEAERQYGALVVSLRIVDVETSKVAASTDVHAVVPSEQGGFSATGGDSVNLKAMAYSKTPQAQALQDMLSEGVKRLQASLPAEM